MHISKKKGHGMAPHECPERPETEPRYETGPLTRGGIGGELNLPSDEALAMFELANDLLIGKIAADRYSYYIHESLRLGREAARRVKDFKTEMGGKGCAVDMFQLYGEAGIEIVWEEKSAEQYGVSFRAQSEYGKDGSSTVLLYRQSIAKLAHHSQMVKLQEEDVLQMHLAHEYFHYLEYNSSEIQNEATMKMYHHGFVSDCLEPVELTRIFGWKRKGGILRCSEIAAHAFAKEMAGIPVLPNYFDYAYLLSVGKLQEKDFFSQAKRYEDIFLNVV